MIRDYLIVYVPCFRAWFGDYFSIYPHVYRIYLFIYLRLCVGALHGAFEDATLARVETKAVPRVLACVRVRVMIMVRVGVRLSLGHP